MVDKDSLRKSILLVLLVSSMFASAMPEETHVSEDFYYTVNEQGEIVFTQILSWQGSEFSAVYEVEVRDRKGKTILEQETDQTRLEVSLPAGDYTYRVSAVNLLGKKEGIGGWVPFTVKKALDPLIDLALPSEVFLEEGDPVLTLEGDRFDRGMKVSLVKELDDEDRIEGTINEIARQRATVSFSADLLDSGEYLVRALNPSGLYGYSRQRLKVSYRYPRELFASAGWMPFATMFDSWFTDTWSEPFYPAGGVTRAAYMITRRKTARWGVEGRLSGRYMKGGLSRAAVDTMVFQLGGGAVYKQIQSERVFIVARAGVSLAVTRVALDYDGISGETAATLDPACYIGGAVQYAITNRVFAEFGVDFEAIFYKGFIGSGLAPSLSVGYIF